MLTSTAIKALAKDHGAALSRVADLARLEGIDTQPSDLLAPYSRAISIAIRLDDAVMDDIHHWPTPDYDALYKAINVQLDAVAEVVATAITGHGHRAYAVPASQCLDRVNYTAALSHKAVAVAAGIGWQGKSLVTISPEHGPRIRLVSVLTDAPLAPDEPRRNRCGGCTKCTDACPAHAIKNVNTDSHYLSRNHALHFERCAAHVEHIKQHLPGVNNLICGVCIRVCPWGKKRL